MFVTGIMLLGDNERRFISKLVSEYGDLMYRRAMYILKNDEDAKDAVQETFLKIIKYVDKFENESIMREKVLTLVEFGLMASIENISKTNFKKSKRRTAREISIHQEYDEEIYEIDLTDCSPGVEDIIISAEERAIVKRAIAELSQELQAAVYLVYSRDFSYSEAADYLGISLSALKDRIYRAKKKIKEILEDDLCEQCDKRSKT